MTVPAQLECHERVKAARARMAAGGRLVERIAPTVRVVIDVAARKQELLAARERREAEAVAEREQARLDRIIKKCRIATAFLPNPKMVVARIKSEVATKHGVTAGEIDGIRRAAHIVAARQEAMWRVKNETKLSYPEIGRRFGDKDHTTVIWAVRQHEARMAGTKLRRIPGAKFSLASTQDPTP
jgi:chromosomal replication initiator protein